MDKCTTVPALACAFALIGSPLLIFASFDPSQALDARPENRVVWPALAAISLWLLVQHRSRLRGMNWPPHIICLLAYLAFAGASVIWAFSPERSLVRFVQQAMITTSILAPSLVAAKRADLLRGMFLCFAVSLVLNLLFVLGGSVTITRYTSGLVNLGYQGYFDGKNYLGECAAVGLLLSWQEALAPGRRRVFGILIGGLALTLVWLSDSKTAFGLAIVCPALAQIALSVRKLTRLSMAVILLIIPLIYVVLSSIVPFNIMDRVAYILYGDSTLTGRTIIWAFAQYEIGLRPIAGWGYQSFWLVPGSPTVTDAPGWVKMMPNAHNGYYDTMLETGYVGLALLLAFIVATLHGIGRLADQDSARARTVLSLALFVICYNYFETFWLRGFEFLWIVFLILVADVGRYWQLTPRGGVAGVAAARPGRQAHRLQMRLS
jgi:exopolysaccharide production protein ExoQ